LPITESITDVSRRHRGYCMQASALFHGFNARALSSHRDRPTSLRQPRRRFSRRIACTYRDFVDRANCAHNSA